MDKFKVTVNILGKDYHMLASTVEEEAYIRKTGKLVESEMRKVLTNNGVSQVSALVYAGMNIADLYFKEQSITENLRVQITQSAEEATKLEKEIARMKADKPKREPKTGKGKTVASPEPVEAPLQNLLEEIEMATEEVAEKVQEKTEGKAEEKEEEVVDTNQLSLDLTMTESTLEKLEKLVEEAEEQEEQTKLQDG